MVMNLKTILLSSVPTLQVRKCLKRFLNLSNLTICKTSCSVKTGSCFFIEKKSSHWHLHSREGFGSVHFKIELPSLRFWSKHNINPCLVPIQGTSTFKFNLTFRDASCTVRKRFWRSFCIIDPPSLLLPPWLFWKSDLSQIITMDTQFISAWCCWLQS